jgi:exodeoxyribonuclease X
MTSEIAAFIDTEATGLHEPEPVEVTLYIVPGGPDHWPMDENMLWTQRYEPSKAIELGALATHHILQTELRGCPPSASFVLTPAIKYLVGHNVDYDWGVIGKPDVKRICTLALARRIWPELPTHKLTALMYHCFGPTSDIRDRVKQAHGAAADVMMLIDVYYEILDKLDAMGAIELPTTWEALWRVSEEFRIPERMDFGKYGPKPDEGRPLGMLIEEMRRTDRSYVGWLLSGKCDQVNENPYLRKALTR